MINVVYDRNNLCVTLNGHAYSGEPGHDLVCAAVSSLTYTLAANAAMIGGSAEIRLDKGDAEIRCKPKSMNMCVTTVIFNAICVGFEILANDYPEFIKYTIVKG